MEILHRYGIKSEHKGLFNNHINYDDYSDSLLTAINKVKEFNNGVGKYTLTVEKNGIIFSEYRWSMQTGMNNLATGEAQGYYVKNEDEARKYLEQKDKSKKEEDSSKSKESEDKKQKPDDMKSKKEKDTDAENKKDKKSIF